MWIKEYKLKVLLVDLKCIEITKNMALPKLILFPFSIIKIQNLLKIVKLILTIMRQKQVNLK